MKKLLSGILCIITVAALLNSCRKDYAQEDYKEDIPAIKPDLTVKVLTDVSGFVTDENNDPVFNAGVVAGNKTTTTDEFGYFHITDASVPEIAGFVKITKSGYFTGFKTFLAKDGGDAFIRVKLLPRNNPGDIDAASGGLVDLPGGARVSLPANAVVIASSGAAYSGTINVAAHFIDPTNIQASQLQSPGDTRGIDDKEHLRLLNTYSTLAVELTSGSGQLLQIATGKQATITMPVPASMAGSAPATIDLWSFDETNGLWKLEGTATKSGSTYTATVSHFSFWNGAVSVPLVEFSARIVNAALQPLANVAIGIRGASEPLNAGYGRFGYTDADGYVTGSIPANRDMILNVLTPCETEAYSHPFNSGSSDIDMGVLTGNLGQGMVTISGTAIKCNGQPVTNGYVQTYDHGFFNRINIINGAFTFTGLACTNQQASYVAIDEDAYQQGIAQTITLAAGVNNLGTLAACGTSTVSTIAFTLDGVTTTMTEPADEFLAVYNSLNGGTTTLLKLNSPTFNFELNGAPAITGIHKLTEVWFAGFPSGRGYNPAQLDVTLTEYGIPGGFIAGSFSGMMLDFPTNSVHNVSCTFRVRRHQ